MLVSGRAIRVCFALLIVSSKLCVTFGSSRKRSLGNLFRHPNAATFPAVSTAGLIMIGVNKPLNKAGYVLGENVAFGVALETPLNDRIRHAV